MNNQETLEYMQLLDEALELLLEKKECMNIILKSTAGNKREDCFKRLEELEVLLEENSRYIKSFDHLKETVILELQ